MKYTEEELKLIDQFAAQSISGLILHPQGGEASWSDLARTAYSIAQEMMFVRSELHTNCMPAEPCEPCFMPRCSGQMLRREGGSDWKCKTCGAVAPF